MTSSDDQLTKDALKEVMRDLARESFTAGWNAALDTAAEEIDRLAIAFGKDTVSSFTAFIKEFKENSK
jgi:hypothetical protein